MHISAKCGIPIACPLSFCLSVRDVGRSAPHKLEILETNCTDLTLTPSLFVARRLSTNFQTQGNIGKFWED